jgi:hypothetical protein
MESVRPEKGGPREDKQMNVDRTMNLARFVARDPQEPTCTKEELDDLLARMGGVLDWRSHENGDVTVKYDRHRISAELMEDALHGVGFRLHHICDGQSASNEEIEREWGR